MNDIEVMPAGKDRLVPVPGKLGKYFPHDFWTRHRPSFELDRLIGSGDLVARPVQVATPATPESATEAASEPVHYDHGEEH